MEYGPQHPTSAPQQLLASDFEIVSADPGQALCGVVSRITGYRESRRGHYRQREAASLVVPLIISFGEPFAIGLGRQPSHNDRQLSFAAGLYAGPVVIDSFGASHCVQVDFTPLGARRFFRVPMNELANRMIALDDILGREGARLREQLGNETDWQTRFKRVRRFVETRIADADDSGWEIVKAFADIDRSGGRARVSAMAADVGWSRKHLASRFRAELGLGPKSIARIVRFNRALALRKTGAAGWADIAADCGYADQSHLVREFQALSGGSPAGHAA